MKTLVIMAAGMGSRYGGLKQIDPIGPNGEIIIDYSIYDAYKAGFEKVVFIIRRENLEVFKEVIGNKVEKYMDTAYVFQDTDKLPNGISPVENRVKPWGTAHAVMCCKGEVNSPFAVINADDFYGRDAFLKLSQWMDGIDPGKKEYAMAGYILENTLTENGHVSRGVCEVGDNGYLKTITERTKIMLIDGNACYEEAGDWKLLDKKATVSMNCWAFTPDFISETEKRFSDFMKKNSDNLEKAEFFLPSVVCDMINENSVGVKVMKTDGKWMGVTYKEDKEKVCASLREKIREGIYPEQLWSK